jgi:hypothetical protein
MSAAFYVEDACGDKFLFTIADPDYEPAFRKHACWWLRYMERTRYDRNGKMIRNPIRPCKIVVDAKWMTH